MRKKIVFLFAAIVFMAALVPVLFVHSSSSNSALETTEETNNKILASQIKEVEGCVLKDIADKKSVINSNESSYAKEDWTIHMEGSQFSYRLTSEESNHLSVKKTFAVKKNTNYIVMAYVKTENVVNIEKKDGTQCALISTELGVQSCSKALVGTNDWTKVAVSFNSGDRTTISVMMNLGYYFNCSVGTAWFDGFTIKQLTSLKAITSIDKISYAYIDYATRLKGTEYSYCLTSEESNHIKIVKPFTVKKNTNYIITAYIKTKDVVNLENTSSSLCALLSTNVDTWNCSQGVAGTNDWTKVAVSFNSGDRTTIELGMNLGYHFNCSKGTAWFNKLTIKQLTGLKTESPANKISYAFIDPLVHMEGTTYSYCLKSEESNHIKVLRPFTVKKNCNYIITAYIKTNDVANLENKGCSLGALISTNVDTWSCSQGLVGTNDWTKVAVSFNSGDRTTVEMGMNLGYYYNCSVGTAWFDKVTIRQVTSLKTESPSNKVSYAYSDCSVRMEGSEYSYRLVSEESNRLGVKKTFTVKENTQYVASAYIKTEGVVNLENPSSTLSALISTSVDTWSCSQGLVGTNDWTKVTVIFNSGNRTTVDVSMNLGYHFNCSIGTAWFDCLKVTPIDECVSDNTNWSFLCVIPMIVDINYKDEETGKVYKEKYTLTSDDALSITKTLEQLTDDIAEYSNGKFVPCFTFALVYSPYTQITKRGENDFWFAPEDVKKYLDWGLPNDPFDLTYFDHVICAAVIENLPTKYFGLGGTNIINYTGYSFVKFSLESMRDHRTSSKWAPSVFVHEFLHSAENYARVLGYNPPPVHDAEELGYTDGGNDWKQWYTDYINCNITSANGKTGIPEIVWRIKPFFFNR